jgi:prefoldin subunit 5
LRTLRSEISQLLSRLEELEDANNELNQQQESTKRMYEELIRREREDTNRKLDQRDSQIEELKSQVNQLYRKEQSIKEKENLVEQLQHELAQKDLILVENSRNVELQASQLDELKRIHYQSLSQVQKQLREFSMICQDLRDRYNHLNSKISTLRMIKQTLYEFENNNNEMFLREFNSLNQERKLQLENIDQVNDLLQNLEVQLEEERAKSIMLEEKNSRLEQQQEELQRRLEKEAEEQSRRNNNQIRVLNDSLNKMQLQLEEKEKLLNMVQKERAVLAEEKAEVEREYMELLKVSSSDSLQRKTMFNQSNSFISASKRNISPLNEKATENGSISSGGSLIFKTNASKPLILSRTSSTFNSRSYAADTSNTDLNYNQESAGKLNASRYSKFLSRQSRSHEASKSSLDSSNLGNSSSIYESLKHNEDMEQIINQNRNLQEKMKEATAFQQNLAKDLLDN